MWEPSSNQPGWLERFYSILFYSILFYSILFVQPRPCAGALAALLVLPWCWAGALHLVLGWSSAAGAPAAEP